MAQQRVSQASVASSASAVAAACGNWWEIHANGAGRSSLLPTWTGTNARWPQQIAGQHASASGDHEDDFSINANASDHSGSLSMVDSSSAGLTGEPIENSLWSRVLFGIGSSEDMQLQDNHENRENFLEVLTSRSLAMEMLEPACDYLKKLDSMSWEIANNTSSIDSLKHLMSSSSSSYNGRSVTEPGRLHATNLSDLIGNWSIALPSAQLERHLASSACSVSGLAEHSTAQYSMTSNISSHHAEHETVPSSPAAYPVGEMIGERSNATSYAPCYDINGTKTERHHQGMGAPVHSPGTSCTSLHAGLGNSAPGLDNKYYADGVEEQPVFSSTRSLSDVISFSGCLKRPAASMDLRSPKPRAKEGLDSSCSKTQGRHESSSTSRSGRATSGTIEGKKKRLEDSSGTTFKKPKHEASTASSTKLQAPKTKLADKITALQQLVSPFGKTDTASVLLETINCIKVLQEQVQLLSDSYTKTSASKDHSSWGELKDRREKIEKLIKLDLKSKGLCLIPVSCIPPSHRENNGPDYWMPPYRSCLYR